MKKVIREKKILNIFFDKKVMTMNELISFFKCSSKTVQRRLKIWRALTSYNKNSRYYTLPEIVNFDLHGLWHYKGILFSKCGNLNETVIHLIHTAEAGLTGSELGKILNLEPRSFLSHFRENSKLYRKKIDGRFIYFSGEIKYRKKQIEQREKQEKILEYKFPTDAQAVMILVELIKQPALSVEKLTERLSCQGTNISGYAIEQLLIHHDLIKKKAI